MRGISAVLVMLLIIPSTQSHNRSEILPCLLATRGVFFRYRRAGDEAHSRKVTSQVFGDCSSAGVCMPEPPQCAQAVMAHADGFKSRSLACPSLR
ncbi:uncharacterized protein M421DRAFT_414917 [Didymella exigua CBS 183.55]|uniref:Secreted protein n=1 Tax=Didymella exigua CBS 183.55 TaxID=1150837 RepID=A0A6A5S348_9PLEO|nr:uncharacterized protein M421DRAFT_414917 [Didymella exigua CBS 183.55]KAF1933864.1 hypothetical protein M421DRAFT_414917 [Didymella exigua CBS 183.55]